MTRVSSKFVLLLTVLTQFLLRRETECCGLNICSISCIRFLNVLHLLVILTISNRIRMSFKIKFKIFCSQQFKHLAFFQRFVLMSVETFCLRELVQKYKDPLGIKPLNEIRPVAYLLQKALTTALRVVVIWQQLESQDAVTVRTQDVRSAIVRCPASGQRVGWGEDVGVGRAGCRPQPVADHIPTSPEAHINGGRADKVGLTHTRERAPLLIATCFAAATVHSLADLHRLPTVQSFKSPIISVMFVQDLSALKTGFRACGLYDWSWMDRLSFIHPSYVVVVF